MNKTKLAIRILRWFCHRDLIEDIEGDLMELYSERKENIGIQKANFYLWWEVVKLFRLGIVRLSVTYNFNPMWRHNFLISFRTLKRNKTNSIINIAGLTLGMSIAMVIGLWVFDELTFNQFHEHYSLLGKVQRKELEMNKIQVNSSMTTGLGTLLKNEYGNYFDAVGMVRQRVENRLISFKDKKYTQSGYFVQPVIPEMFTLKMVHGDRAGLSEMNSILLSSSLSIKLFGDINPVGEVVQMDANWDLKVTGVYEDLPANSEFREATYFAPLDRYLEGWSSLNIWDNYNMRIYVKVNPQADFENVSNIISGAMLPHLDERRAEANPRLSIQPMKEWHLYSSFENGVVITSLKLKYVWFYSIIGVFILLLACINFTNLSTARAEKRAKEIGIRKTIGSSKQQLVQQFLIESLLFGFASFIISIGFVKLILPWFNTIADKKIIFPWEDKYFWITGITFTLVTSLIAGSYPAFYLASIKTLSVLKRKVTIRSSGVSALSRKLLVIFQFAISISLIIGTLVIYKQLMLAKERPAGYKKEHLISLNQRSSEYRTRYATLRAELLNTGVVTEVASSNYSVTSTLGWNSGFTWEGKQPDYDPSFNTIWVNHEYGTAVGMEVVEGRDFSRDYAEESGNILINESALALLKIDNPIGKKMMFNAKWMYRNDFTIVGVVKDMVKGSPFEATHPSIIFLDPNAMANLYIRIKPNADTQESIKMIGNVFEKILPSSAFEFKFADDEYNQKFKAEERIGQLAGYFAGITIFISCIGLFGLTLFVVEQRTKEIGIRKVLGAKTLYLWKLMSVEYVILTLIACLIACPLSYYFLKSWLSGYAIKTDISWWIFPLAGCCAIVLTILTVSFQAIKVAIQNPVKALRYE